MTTTPTIWKPAFTVDTQTDGIRSVPQSIGLANGNVVVVWEIDTFGETRTDIHGQIFDPLGNALGAEFRVNAIQYLGDQTDPKIAALPDGGFVMAYGSYDPDVGVPFLAVERFNGAGVSVSADLISEYPDEDSDITVNGQGDYIFAFTTSVNTHGVTHAFAYDHATNSRGPELDFGENSGPHGLATFANGNLIEVFGDGGRGSLAKFTIISATGSPLAVSIVYGGTDDLSAEADDVAVLTDGRFVVLSHYGDHRALRIGSLDASNHVTLGSEILVSTDAGSSHIEQASVVALPDGGFYVAWVASAPEGTLDSTIVGTRYSSNGAVIGNAASLIASTPHPSSPGDLSLTSDGRILVSMYGFTNQTFSEIFEVIVDPRDTTIAGTNGPDVLTAQTTASTVSGAGGNDTLYGGPGDDTLNGGAGNDQLNGGAGLDTLTGGTNDDTYVLADVNQITDGNGNVFVSYDTVTEAAGGGIDTVLVQRVSGFGNPTSYTLPANVEIGAVQGTLAFNLIGNALANTLTGNSAANTLNGGADLDSLAGGAGDDTYVLADVNQITDSGGNVLVTYDTVIEAAGGGNDTVLVQRVSGFGNPTSYTLPANVENGVIQGTLDFNLIGNALANTLTGNSGVNTLNGGGGDDFLDGGAGNDFMSGGANDDTYVVDSAGDQVIENAGEGTDTVRTTLANYTLGANVENLTFTGSGTHVGFGNALSNVMTGGTGDDTLVAHTVAALFAAEHDTLLGGGGNDTLYGEAADTLDGGTGFDVLQVINAYDMNLDLAATSIEYVVSDFGNDTFTAATGSIAVEVYGGGGNDTITGGSAGDRLWGGVGNDTLVGNDGNDVLVGDLGADSLSGGAGNDSLYIDSGDTFIDGGADFDAAYITTGSGINLNMATTHLEWVADFAGGNDTIDASGVSVHVEMYAAGGNDILTGGSADDLIFAGLGNDTIVGGAGNDTLVGEAGSDRLTGGLGNDRLYGTNGAGGDGAIDTFVFTTGWGSDIVFDFEHNIDKLDMTGVTGVHSMADLTITSNGGNAYIAFGGDLISVAGMAGQITQNDLLFA